MKNIEIGPIETSNIGLGLMRIADKSDDEIRSLVGAAREAGINFFDHADIYGSHLHECEERFASALQLSSSEREEVTIQTKAGIVKNEGYYDFSYHYLVGEVEDSLRALGTDYIDILLLHRPDALVEPEEVARAFNDLAASGKVRYFGASNHTPCQIELLKHTVDQPLVVNQVQLSIAHCPMIAQGVASNMMHDQSTDRDGGLIEYARLSGITLQAWSPFQSGTGHLFDAEWLPGLNAVMDRVAAEYQVSPEAIATAWITRHPANIQVILGSTSPDRVRAAAAGSELRLTRAQWYELFRSAGHVVP
ncbi:aldo/keto reductase [Trueperella pecoris]|uniref:Aldo/keto reductase n=1 Tax=Trueperella pecoris TaxID=2733571 RepID=A0A7M1QWE3_9ACTO|nr:aldo/keto reductase [Trueperella pecoris]QOR46173.1 aldo/keto reductase [Trueperella pecoris]QTG75999.1 aldo/keto reductase [Trueperella pecoris]